MKYLSLAIIVAISALSVYPVEARNCRKGIPCGNSCISANKTCRIGSSSAPSTPRYVAPRVIAPAPIATPQVLAAPQAPAIPASQPQQQPKDQRALHAYPSPTAPITGYFIPGQDLNVYGSAGDWILISPLSSENHQWMLQHGAK